MSQETADDFSAAMRLYRDASWAVMNDLATWEQEAKSCESRLMAWPRPVQGTSYQRLLAILFNSDVNAVTDYLQTIDHPFAPPHAATIADPKLQLLLRVVQRGLDAGDAAMVSEFGGERVTGRRRWLNGVRKELTEAAIKSGLKRAEAFAALGISRAAAYRAMKRRSG